MKTTTKKRKTKRSFSKRSFFHRNRLKKGPFSKTIVNDDPSLTIVNEERRSEETDLKGMGTFH